MSLEPEMKAHIYYKHGNGCAAFLSNIDKSLDANVTFNGRKYNLPAWSVSVLPDCNKVIFNTAKVVAQKSLGHVLHPQSTRLKDNLQKTSSWSWYKEQVGIWSENSFPSSSLLEQINTTRDISDFLWYTTSVDVNEKLRPGQAKEAFLSIESLGHAALVFVNKKIVGFGYGNHEDASFTFNKKIKLKQGKNTLAFLSMIIGLQNYGPWFDVAGAGIFSVFLADLKGMKYLSSTEWVYQVGLEGEYLGLDKVSLANSSLWISGSELPTNQSLIWYKTTFTAPEGKGPLSLNLASMGKGQAWVNGQSIGRYWSSYLSPSTGCTDNCDYRGSYDANKCIRNCGQPAQTLYHVPRSWVHAGENLLVLHEELGGDPSKISAFTRKGHELCSQVSESDLPPVDSWKPDSEFMSLSPQVRLSCERGWTISTISFASFGTPEGQCGKLSHGTCHAQNVLQIVQEACVGHEECMIPVSTAILGDPCPGVSKSLAVEALCSV